jgi:hypothetical protein
MPSDFLDLCPERFFLKSFLSEGSVRLKETYTTRPPNHKAKEGCFFILGHRLNIKIVMFGLNILLITD